MEIDLVHLHGLSYVEWNYRLTGPYVPRRPHDPEGRPQEDPDVVRRVPSNGDAAFVSKGKIANTIIGEFTVHTYLENEVMYPEVLC